MSFNDAYPFPYVIVDNLISLEEVRELQREWPKDGWSNHTHEYSDKRCCDRWECFGATGRRVIGRLKSETYLRYLRDLSGIWDLEPDAALYGEGFHETLNGGFLDLHVDFNRHPETKLYRRLNLLLFLNEGWQDDWGGCLELWDCAKPVLAKRIEPEAGRAVIFATSERSFHGHPIPLNRPDGGTRRSLALYYYSPTPAMNAPDHSTVYVQKVLV